MTPRLSGHFSISVLVFFVLKSLLGIARQWSREKFAVLSLNPRSHFRILIYRTWAICNMFAILQCYITYYYLFIRGVFSPKSFIDSPLKYYEDLL